MSASGMRHSVLQETGREGLQMVVRYFQELVSPHIQLFPHIQKSTKILLLVTVSRD